MEPQILLRFIFYANALYTKKCFWVGLGAPLAWNPKVWSVFPIYLSDNLIVLAEAI